jgi:hypothetical protein
MLVISNRFYIGPILPQKTLGMVLFIGVNMHRLYEHLRSTRFNSAISVLD